MINEIYIIISKFTSSYYYCDTYDYLTDCKIAMLSPKYKYIYRKSLKDIIKKGFY